MSERKKNCSVHRVFVCFQDLTSAKIGKGTIDLVLQYKSGRERKEKKKKLIQKVLKSKAVVRSSFFYLFILYDTNIHLCLVCLYSLACILISC